MCEHRSKNEKKNECKSKKTEIKRSACRFQENEIKYILIINKIVRISSHAWTQTNSTFSHTQHLIHTYATRNSNAVWNVSGQFILVLG